MDNIDLSAVRYIKLDKPTTFICGHCKKEKTAKKHAEYVIGGTCVKICNACYGYWLSPQIKKAGGKMINSQNEMDVADGKVGHILKPSISSLSSDKIEYICRQITPREIRHYFQKNPKPFSQIRPGFRSASLSDDDAIAIVCKNTRNHFISSYLEKWVGRWLAEIQEYCEKAEADNVPASKALVTALSESVFDSNIELFFELSDKDYGEEYITLVKTAMGFLSENKDLRSDVAHRQELIDENGNSQFISAEDAEQLRAERDASKAKYEEAISQMAATRSEIDGLSEKYAGLAADKAALTEQLQYLQRELDHFHRLKEIADTDSNEEYSSAYEYASVCSVFYDYSNQIWLSRLADIKDGRIVRFIRNEDIPPYFGNHDRLFWANGPRDDGYIGVWQWNSQPRDTDPTKDVVTTMHINGASIIEIVFFSDCHSFKEIGERITTQSFQIASRGKVLFACKTAAQETIGLLCNKGNFIIDGGNVMVRETVLSLPQYRISSDDILNLAGKSIYAHTSLGIPLGMQQIRNPVNLVKDIVLKEATSAVLRQQGLSKKEAQHCQAFLKNLPTETLWQTVASACSCSEEVARGYIDTFITQAESYLSQSDIETEVLASAIERAPQFTAQCMALLSESWESANAQRLNDAKNAFEEITRAVSEQRNNQAVLLNECSDLEKKLHSIQAEIQEKEKLAADVEAGVADRIARAQQKAADFIASMAFVQGSSTPGKNAISSAEEAIIQRQVDTIPGCSISDKEDYVDELIENFQTVGYDGVTATHMAELVTICMDNLLPLICGSNELQIGDCIAAMYGNAGAYATTISTDQGNSGAICEAITSLCSSKPGVFVISGAFDGFSLNAYKEILLHQERWGRNAILIFALGGVHPSMLPPYIWERAMFIDGDIGLKLVAPSSLSSHSVDNSIFNGDSIESVEELQKILRPFSGIVSNLAAFNYMKYMDLSGSTVTDDIQLLLQIVCYALSGNKIDKLRDILSAMRKNVEDYPELLKYL